MHEKLKSRLIPLLPIVDGKCACGPTCKAIGKHPNKNGRFLEGAGVGVQTGDGLIVLDIDVKNGKNGFTTLANRELPDTYSVKTPTGGQHLYYSYDPIVYKVGNKVGFLPGCDIRGEGGYVVGAGSPHVNGGLYQATSSDAAITPCPEWLLLHARQHELPTELPTPIDKDHPNFEEFYKRCVKELNKFPPAIEGEGGHTTLFRAAQIPIRKYQLSYDVAEQLLNDVYNPRCQPPWSLKEIEHKVEQAATHGRDVLGVHDWLENLVTPPLALKAAKGYKFDIGQPSPANKSKISPANVLNVLLTHPDWNNVFRYNTFRQRLVAIKPPMRLNAEPIGLTEVDCTLVTNWFEIEGYTTTNEVVERQIRAAAEANCFHPLREYLDALPSPSTNHLATLAFEMYGDDSEWAQRFLTNALVGAVRRIYQPGCTFNYTLVLVGNQGAGKSQSIRALFGEEFSSEQFPDLSDMVRACQDIQGYWTIEAAELHSIRSHKAVEAAKAFITRDVDTFTPKYGRSQVYLPRQCIFIGTTNEEDFLRDKTGNRRFQPIHVRKVVDRKWIQSHRDEIWAEAKALALTDFVCWFTQEEDAIIDDKVRKNYEQYDPWFEVVQDMCAGEEFIRAQDIFLRIDTEAHGIARYDYHQANRLCNILRQLGCISMTKRVNKKVVRVWYTPAWLRMLEPTTEEHLMRELKELGKN